MDKIRAMLILHTSGSHKNGSVVHELGPDLQNLKF